MRTIVRTIAPLTVALACGDATVTETKHVASVRVTAPSPWIFLGDSAQFAATVTTSDGGPLSGAPVAWTTSDGAVAHVNAAGMVFGRGVGTARIFASSAGKIDSADVNVLAPKVESGTYGLRAVDGGRSSPFLLVDATTSDGTRRQQWLVADTIRFGSDGRLTYVSVRRFIELPPDGEGYVDDVELRGGGYFEQLDDKVAIAWNYITVPPRSGYTDTLTLRVDGLARFVHRPPTCFTCPVGPLAEYLYLRR
jgi:hypothetical protein